MMKTVKLTEDKINAFREYYNKYSPEQDESFPVLTDYKVSADEPVYLLTDDAGNIHGAAALLLRKEYLEIKESRFRIFHCIEKNTEHYRILLDEIQKHTGGLNSIYGFLQDKYTDSMKVWEELGFQKRRFAWILGRNSAGGPVPAFPDGFELRVMRDGIDENAWCDIINESFAEMLGHTHLYPEKIEQWKKEDIYIPGGMIMLWDKNTGKPLAVMGLNKENSEGEEVIFIDGLGVLKAYQGKGIGRNLIRWGIDYAKQNGFKRVMLSVNAENEKAAELYFNEGFKKSALYICYHYNTKN